MTPATPMAPGLHGEKMAKPGIDRRGALALLAGGMCALPLAACDALGHSLPTYRYRLTVEVETPEGVRTGSSVIEVHTSVAGRYSIPTPGVVSHRVIGEAVTVDLGSRGNLFALLRTENDLDWPGNIMFRMAHDLPRVHFQGGKYDSDRNFQAQFMAMLQHRDLVVLPSGFPSPLSPKGRMARPLLVRFKNLADPGTIEKLDPDDLVRTFGEGVRLRWITVQITDDPVTTGIVKKLPWLLNVHGNLTKVPSGKSINDMPFGSYVFDFDFMKGSVK